MTQIKICGISNMRGLDAVIAARADYGGFVFYPPSPRNVQPGEAAELTSRARGHLGRAGLFVNPQDDFLAEVLSSADLDVMQLQGSESPERVAQIKSRFGIPIWKAVSVATREDVQRAEIYRELADFILFDAKTPPSALPGGMGLKFDWTLLADYDVGMPWGLAGGLDAGNVDDAIAATNAPLVDVCSGTESAPGIKDVDRIAAFCKAARNSG